MASPIRIKDISRTVTTAAANEYLAVDGPNGSGKMLTPDPRGTAALAAAAACAAHNADAGAHLNIIRRTLSANLTLTSADPQHQRIIPDADRDVTLPAESAAQWRFLLCHAGASYNITIKRAGGTAVGVLIPGSVAAVAWDGTAVGYC